MFLYVNLIFLKLFSILTKITLKEQVESFRKIYFYLN